MYHPDYLGNNEFITDLNGDPYQYFWYSAFGEAIVSDHSLNGTYDSPWRFNGKEFDPETGNYYYGARYFDPMVSQWLSVDALAMHPTQVDKSPYAFTWNNPINLVDPDGNCPSCKTEEDWRIYQAQLDSYDLPLSAFGVDEGGNRIAYIDGKVIDIVRHKSRMDAYFAITPVDVLIPVLLGSFPTVSAIVAKMSRATKAKKVARSLDDVAGESVDLVGTRKEHILNRHKAGAGKPGRTEFPESWSDERIISEVNKIANDPNAYSGVGKWESPYKTGTVDGIEIRVDFYPTTHPTKAGKVSTAYPTNTTSNSR